MQLVFVRHAEAEPQYAAPHRRDSERRLTPRGRRDFRRVAADLKQHLAIDFIASSPLQRARETAAILQRALKVDMQLVRALAPQQPSAQLWAWLRRQSPQATIALVGHEPDLAQQISWMLARRRHAFLKLARGGTCALQFDGAPRAGSARLLWLH